MHRCPNLTRTYGLGYQDPEGAAFRPGRLERSCSQLLGGRMPQQGEPQFAKGTNARVGNSPLVIFLALLALGAFAYLYKDVISNLVWVW
jgi:hypothetical protein